MQGFDPNFPIRISFIKVKGNERTKETYFQNEFSESAHCRNINELHQHLSAVTQQLQQSGLFEGVETNININSSANKKDITSKLPEYDITINVLVKEVGIPQLKMESYLQTGTEKHFERVSVRLFSRINMRRYLYLCMQLFSQINQYR
jgi:hypothetical protein